MPLHQPRCRLLEVTSLARWTGQPTGMLRVEHELAKHALQVHPAVTLVIFDRDGQSYRPIRTEYRGRVVDWMSTLVDPPPPGHAGRRSFPRIVPSRLALLQWLEKARLRARSANARRRYDRLEQLLLSVRAAPIKLRDDAGRRIDLLFWNEVVGEPVRLEAGDVLFSASSAWGRYHPGSLRGLKERGVRFATQCADIIPLTHPRFFEPAVTEQFRQHWDAAFAVAETVVVNAAAIQDDVVRYCQAQGIVPPPLEIVPLGCERPQAPADGNLPSDRLSRGRYALYVSTVEPRKNHALLLKVWRRLLSQGIPQAQDFKLVFVGRRGWMVDEILAEIDELSSDQGRVLHLDNIDDDGLWRLYEQAAFCLYPSHYEGFGLPVVEAMARGKAIAVSTGGALPEASQGLAPQLSPDDADGWTALVGRWISEPEAVGAAAARIREGFSLVTWGEVAAATFAKTGLSDA